VTAPAIAAQDTIAALRAENARLRVGLEAYADGAHWKVMHSCEGDPLIVWARGEGPDLARRLLATNEG
jgi:hypothetical protein